MKPNLLIKLEYEARVKPEIAELVAKVNDMTDEEIDASKTPLPWFKQALKLLKQFNKSDGEMTTAIYGSNPDPVGSLVHWKGDAIMLPTKGAGSGDSFVELTNDTLLLLMDNGTMWLHSSFMGQIDPRLVNLPVIKRMTKTEYNNEFKNQLLAKYNMPTGGDYNTYNPRDPWSAVRIG